MMRNFHKTFVVFAIIATFASGCRSTDEYKKFAEAGNNFVDATNSLLDTAGQITIKATSEQLLRSRRDRMLANGNKPLDGIDNIYNEFSDQDKNRLALISELRNHNRLLQAYFSKLIELAGSDSPVRTEKAVGNITAQLEGSSSRLLKLSPIKIDKLPSVTKIVLDSRIRGSLRKELEKRKDTIYREITIQEEVLKKISEFVREDIETIQELQEKRLVIAPFKSEEINEDSWIDTRLTVLTQNAQIILAINKASDNLSAFKELYIASIEGELTRERVNNFIQETNSFTALVSEQK
ncbi:hypothetical protein [Nostoc sp. FACHB-145]|uniref:hypothetical protein n=1 Tax=Nostoc sp. FACHB-145 TaxID=2692836 RepID=UPI001682DCB2|nr:hypothetical protein [Nostoc sp. FACHB-145]MBD2471995.1 hypothetical protein [Nostoc sp. FACHB-145]